MRNPRTWRRRWRRLCFALGREVTIAEAADILERSPAAVSRSAGVLAMDLRGRGLMLQRSDDAMQLATRPEMAWAVQRALHPERPARLSRAAMETLAIIAYRQPVTKAVLESIRGVDCEAVLEHLSERGLIAEVARQDTPGHPRSVRHDAAVSSAPGLGADRRSAAGARERGPPQLRVSVHPPERLNRFLARRGVASRRGADELIAQGRVTVNGEVSRLGAVVQPSVDRVSVDGHRIPTRAVSVTLVLNKPPGVVTTRSDPYQRRTVMDLIAPVPGLVPIGRLDADSRGLLVLTTDGDLAHAVSHPRHGVTKRYLATLDRAISVRAARAAPCRRRPRGRPGSSARCTPRRVRLRSRGGHGGRAQT